DAYYVAIGLPFLLYNLLGVPFSLWVTARLAAVDRAAPGEAPRIFYRGALWWGCAASVLLALGLAALSRPILRFYAPGLEGARLDEAAALARLGAVALPALVLQAVCGARLFAGYRPNPIPVRAEAASAARTDHSGTCAGIGVRLDTASATTPPASMPTAPPTSVRVEASTRNCHWMARRVAPSALRTPISR